jgi:hypothetical protein
VTREASRPTVCVKLPRGLPPNQAWPPPSSGPLLPLGEGGAIGRRKTPVFRRAMAPDEGTRRRRAGDKAMTAKHPHPRPFSRGEKGKLPRFGRRSRELRRGSTIHVLILRRDAQHHVSKDAPDRASADGASFETPRCARPSGRGGLRLQAEPGLVYCARKNRTITREASSPTACV